MYIIFLREGDIYLAVRFNFVKAHAIPLRQGNHYPTKLKSNCVVFLGISVEFLGCGVD